MLEITNIISDGDRSLIGLHSKGLPAERNRDGRSFMSKKDSQQQKVFMSLIYRGKEIFKPLNTGWIDEHVACVREWIANIFFYTKNGTTIMIDAGYNYDRLKEKMGWLDIDPASIHHILITHQDTDHVGALETDSDGLFPQASIYLSEIENRYLTGQVRRKVMFGAYKLPMVKTNNPKILLKDGDILDIDGIKIEAILVPGHTWGHLVYLIDDSYLFTGDTLWFGADGGYSFINALAEDNNLSVRSLAMLEKKLRERNITPKIITGHTGWTDSLDFAFAHRSQLCNSFKKQTPHDPKAPYDGYDESDDTEEKARTVRLEKQNSDNPRALLKPDYANWMPKEMVAGSVLGTGALLAGGLTFSKKETRAGKILGGTLLAGAAVCGVFAVYSAYARKAFSYDGPRKLSKQIIEGIAEYVTLPDGGTGLDVGCGSGALTIACAKRNPNAFMVGIDHWGPEYKDFSKTVCEKNAIAEGVQNVRFEQGNAVKLNFEDESFDAVTSNYVYHNIAGINKQTLLLETLRVLKKGGVFAIHDLMEKNRYGDMQSFAGKLRAMGYQEVHLISTTDEFFRSPSEASCLLLAGSTLLYGIK